MAEPHAELVERLAAHKTLGQSPRHELEWLALHGELRSFAAGETVVAKGQVAPWMVVMFSGHGVVWVDRGSGRRKIVDWGPGDVTGLIPFSRIQHSIGDALMDEP